MAQLVDLWRVVAHCVALTAAVFASFDAPALPLLLLAAAGILTGLGGLVRIVGDSLQLWTVSVFTLRRTFLFGVGRSIGMFAVALLAMCWVVAYALTAPDAADAVLLAQSKCACRAPLDLIVWLVYKALGGLAAKVGSSATWRLVVKEFISALSPLLELLQRAMGIATDEFAARAVTSAVSGAGALQHAAAAVGEGMTERAHEASAAAAAALRRGAHAALDLVSHGDSLESAAEAAKAAAHGLAGLVQAGGRAAAGLLHRAG
jgi:hypothetical protein